MIHDGLASTIKDVPSVIYGKASFDTQTRRVAGARAVYLVVKSGQFVLWDGKKPSAVAEGVEVPGLRAIQDRAPAKKSLLITPVAIMRGKTRTKDAKHPWA